MASDGKCTLFDVAAWCEAEWHWATFGVQCDLEVFSWRARLPFHLDKPKEEKKDTFLEKLATQVIKNVQVQITGIHIKYEDDVSIMNSF